MLTGASRGLGRTLAKKLDQLGCKLICWDINERGLESLKPRLDPQVMHVFQRVDVSKPEEIKYALAMSPNQQINIVIANAGVVTGKSITQLEIDEYERTLHVNLFQHFYLFHHTHAKLDTLPGKSSEMAPTFVMVASVCGMLALTNLSDYCSSKFGVVGLAEGMRLDLRRLGSKIHTLVVLPFLITTRMFSGVTVKQPASWILSPLKKNDVADAIIAGIQQRKHWIVLPWILQLAPLLLILPVWARNLLYDSISESTYMDEFKGHNHPSNSIRRLPTLSTSPRATQRMKRPR